MDLEQFQAELAVWSARNFGSDPAHCLHPLLGLCEEVGELAAVARMGVSPVDDATACVADLLVCQALLGRVIHDVLKGLQGIRGHGAARVTELSFVADQILEFMTFTCERAGVAVTFDPVVLASRERQAAETADAVGDIDIYLTDFCRRNGLSRAQVLAETWARVSKRDWVANPATGGATSNG